MKKFLLTIAVMVSVTFFGGSTFGRGWTGAPPPSATRPGDPGTGVGGPQVTNKAAATTEVGKPGATPAAGKGGTTPEARGPAKIDVKNIENGVTITITSPDPAMAPRIQKLVEAMRLMNEAIHP